MNSSDPSSHRIPPGNRKKQGRLLWLSVLLPPLVCLILPFATIPFYKPQPGYNFLGPAENFLAVAIFAVPISVLICWGLFAYYLNFFSRGWQYGLMVSIAYPVSQAVLCLALAGVGCAANT